MTRAEFFARPGLHGLRVRGHAGYAPAGQDIVCAGISTLNWMAAALLRAQGIRAVCRGSGDRFWLYTADARAEPVLRVLAEGYRQLAETYPDHLRLTGAETI